MSQEDSTISATQPHVPSDLVATLRRCCDALAATTTKHDVPSSRLAVVSRGLVTTTTFLQVAEQQPISALGVDLVAAARWLSEYYDHCAAEVKQQSRPLLFGGNGQALGGPTAAQLGNVGEALVATSAMWREVAEASEVPAVAADAMTFSFASHDATQDDIGAIVYIVTDDIVSVMAGDGRVRLGIVAGFRDGEVLVQTTADDPPTVTYHGVVRIWTAVAAALATTITSGQLRGSRQEVVVVTQLMVSTAREAAVMAEAMGREE